MSVRVCYSMIFDYKFFLRVQVKSLARCEEIPDSDLGTGAWRVTGQGGELLEQMDPNKLTRLANIHILR